MLNVTAPENLQQPEAGRDYLPSPVFFRPAFGFASS